MLRFYEHRRNALLRNRNQPTTPDGVDVSEIAKQYGGGGHRNAAGFQIPYGHELTK